jgi:large subunit ribosomal protein L34e
VKKLVRPAYRSRSRARQKRNIPGNQTRVHYIKRQPSQAHCAITGMILHGVPHLRPSRLRKLPRSSRRPNRPFGGVISHIALQEAIRGTILHELKAQQKDKEE